MIQCIYAYGDDRVEEGDDHDYDTDDDDDDDVMMMWGVEEELHSNDK